MGKIQRRSAQVSKYVQPAAFASVLHCALATSKAASDLRFRSFLQETSEMDQMVHILNTFIAVAGPEAFIAIGGAFDSRRKGHKGAPWANTILERWMRNATKHNSSIHFVHCSEAWTSQRCCRPECRAQLIYPKRVRGSVVYRLLCCHYCNEIFHWDNNASSAIGLIAEAQLRGDPHPFAPEASAAQ